MNNQPPIGPPILPRHSGWYWVRLPCGDHMAYVNVSARTYEKRGNWEREANNIVNEFLMQMDRLQNGSLIAFTTNFNGALDPAAARRIAVKIEIPNPTPEALEAHSQLLLKKWPFLSQREDWWKHTTSKSFAEHEETMRSAARRMIVEGMVKKPP